MNKREFLKTSGAFLTSTLISGFASGETTGPRTNWAGNLTYHTDNLLTPKSLEETQQLVKSTHKLRALGSRHSFNTIADSTTTQISLTAPRLHGNRRRRPTPSPSAPASATAPSPPGIDSQGYAVHNLASLPHITVAGAIATATHGSGVKNGNLSTAVSAPRNRHRRRPDRPSLPRQRRRPTSTAAVVAPRLARRRHQSHPRRPADAST